MPWLQIAWRWRRSRTHGSGPLGKSSTTTPCTAPARSAKRGSRSGRRNSRGWPLCVIVEFEDDKVVDDSRKFVNAPVEDRRLPVKHAAGDDPPSAAPVRQRVYGYGIVHGRSPRTTSGATSARHTLLGGRPATGKPAINTARCQADANRPGKQSRCGLHVLRPPDMYKYLRLAPTGQPPAATRRWAAAACRAGSRARLPACCW